MKKIIILSILLMTNIISYAQFNTLQKVQKTGYVKIERPKKQETNKDTVITIDTLQIKEELINTREQNKDRSAYRMARKKPVRNSVKGEKTEGLTITALYEEIISNGIQHPKIVLAQAILETGWFRSSVCRNKGNLFGLTNPRTGEYYEFNHWTESVKAYYDKVQYRYKGGNYLLWLKKIGYAEDPRYIQSLSEVITQYLL